MKKTVLLFISIGISIAAYAGMVDHEDGIDFPNVNVDAHLLKIARYYYPEASPELPKGVPAKEAWVKDVREAANGLDIPQEQLQKFIAFVVNPLEYKPVVAPHKKLLEFEIYTRGKRALYFKETKADIPAEWTQLLSLPLEQRRYTTIPALYSMYNRLPYPQGLMDDDYRNQIVAARKNGCVDTQGLERAMMTIEPTTFRYIMETTDLVRKEQYYHALFREFAVNWKAEKEWRYVNQNDIWRWAEDRGDHFYSGKAMSALFYFIYSENEETLRELCKRMPSMRDFVIAIGLTNKEMPSARKIAAELAYQSSLNYPVLALRVPLKDAEKLLVGKPEHARLLAQLRLKQLQGMEKIQAIEAYMATYSDYTEKEMPITSIALHTYEELQAYAGLEYYKLGKYREALERWMKGGTPEDIGLIAEQIFTTDELLDYCKKYTAQTITDDYVVSSKQCSGYNKMLYPNIGGRERNEFILHHILARRLMREKRYAEAKRWFAGTASSYYPKMYFKLQEKLNDSQLERQEKLETCLRLAALIRFRGDCLFGTFLEPDNVICQGVYRCQWGMAIKNPKLLKPNLPRFHYRWIAAEYYRKAAEFTDDPKIKGFCFWAAGTLLKNRAPKLANTDYQKLAKIDPSLIEKNWFKRLQNVPQTIQQWYNQKVFIFGSAERFAAWKTEMPLIEKVELPKNDGTPAALLKTGFECYQKASYTDSIEYKQAMYAFFLAGQKGLADGYFACGLCYFNDFKQYEDALTLYKHALELKPEFTKVKYELGRTYLALGLCKEGLAIIQHIIDTEQEDKEVVGLAACSMGVFYQNGSNGLKKDAEKAMYYLKKSAEAGCTEAKKLLQK